MRSTSIFVLIFAILAAGFWYVKSHEEVLILEADVVAADGTDQPNKPLEPDTGDTTTVDPAEWTIPHTLERRQWEVSHGY